MSKYIGIPEGTICHYCPELATTQDHIVPKSRRGPTLYWNLIPSCEPCNNKKANSWPTCVCPMCSKAVTRWRALSVLTPSMQDSLILRETRTVQIRVQLTQLMKNKCPDCNRPLVECIIEPCECWS